MTAVAGPASTPRRPPDMTRHAAGVLPQQPDHRAAQPDRPAGAHLGRGRARRRVPGVRGDAWFDYPYEGPPTCVHGGVIAETFDEMLGAANMVADNPAMTGTLTIRYRKPTPLRTALVSRPVVWTARAARSRPGAGSTTATC